MSDTAGRGDDRMYGEDGDDVFFGEVATTFSLATAVPITWTVVWEMMNIRGGAGDDMPRRGIMHSRARATNLAMTRFRRWR